MTSFFMFYYSLRDNVFFCVTGSEDPVWSPLRVGNREIRHQGGHPHPYGTEYGIEIPPACDIVVVAASPAW